MIEWPRVDAAVLCAGEGPLRDSRRLIERRVREERAFLACCDSAFETAEKLGLMPDVVIGDGDSLDDRIKKNLGARWIHVTEQDTNDMAKAHRYIVSKFGKGVKVEYYGATGLRTDHAIGNVFHLVDFNVETESRIVDDYGIYFTVDSEMRFDADAGSAISVFSPHDANAISSEGLEWELNGANLGSLWSGTLNRVKSPSVSIRCEKPVIVFLAWKAEVRK